VVDGDGRVASDMGRDAADLQATVERWDLAGGG